MNKLHEVIRRSVESYVPDTIDKERFANELIASLDKKTVADLILEAENASNNYVENLRKLL